MLKHTINYTDFNDQPKQKVVYFNISKSELAIREVESDQGFSESLKRIGQSKKGSEILPEFRNLLKWGYGVIAEDGETFEKSDALWEAFEKTAAYDVLIVQLITDADFAARFMTQMLPADMQKQLSEQQAVPGFRPGADTSRPTPPVAGGNAVQQSAPAAPAVQPQYTQPQPASPIEVVPQMPTPDQFPIPYPGQPVTPGEVQQTSEPRPGYFDNPNQQ